MSSDTPTRSETGVSSHALATAATKLDTGGGDEPGLAPDLLGTRVGRYVVLERLGQGGMGVVYAALDSALERKVALKLLPALAEDRRAHFEARLRREAQALARLEHPNVVGVYDVGVSETSVFVAMQLVDGSTLADHVRDAKPATRELLALFAAAGRGLAAAHEAGIVHRDVKPSNIFVDKDGAVFVGDFGLARGTDEADLPAPTGSLLDDQMTRVGAILGTPPYMSPEQHRGEPATPRSDQYSFCVSLWLMLFGEHPFARMWTSSAVAAASRDELREPTKRVPARVVRALRRGLRANPEARWPAMADLIAEIAPRSRAPLLWGAAAAAAMVGVAVVTASLSGGADVERSCTIATRRLDAIWPANEQAITDVLTAAKLDPAKVTGPIGEYADRWREARRAACGEEITATMRDLQAQCLDDELRVFDDVIGQLRAGAKPLLAHAVDIVARLPRTEACSVGALAAVPAVPAAALVAVSDARVAIVRARIQSYIGEIVAARAGLERSLATARELGYQPLVAEVELARAELLFRIEDATAGDAAVHAAEVATTAHLDRHAATAYALALVDAANRPDLPRAELLTPIARAAANRVGEPIALAKFDTAAAAVATAGGRIADAIALCKDAAAQAEKLTGAYRDEADDDTAACYTNTYIAAADTPNAAIWVEKWLAVLTHRYGPETLGTLPALRELSNVRYREGKLETAIDFGRRVVSISDRALGPDHTEIDDLSFLAQLFQVAGRLDEAIAVARRIEPLVAKTAPTDLRRKFLGEMSLGQLFHMLNNEDESHRHYDAALKLGEQLPPDDEHLATARFGIGMSYAEAGDLQHATELVDKAAAAWSHTHNPRAYVADGYRAELLVRGGHCTEAIPMFEAAIAGMERTRSDRVNLVRAQLHLAMCIGITDTVRARALVQAVLRTATDLGESGKDLVATARAWLDTDGGSRAARTGPTQWAGVVRGYSSQYGAASWSAAQALGAPDTYPSAGDARTAWASLAEDADTEWIEVGFDEPERARAIAIYETFNPGAVILVELVTASGMRTVYRGTAAPVAATSRIQTIDFPCTTEPVLGVRITLGSKAVPGWNEIDAIGAVGCRP